MKIKQVMVKKVISIKSDSTVEQAAKILIKNNISGAPIVSKSGKLVGIVSEKDLFKAIYPNLQDIIKHLGLWLDKKTVKHRVDAKRKQPITRIMAKQVITAKPDDPILKAGSVMLVKRIHRMPVVDKGQIVGIVSRRDIFRKLLKADFNM